MIGTLKILMLEDSATDAELIQKFLRREMPGCVFEQVMTAKDFLESLHSFKPDIVLSDNTMPQFNATEALTLFKQQQLPIPFILVTGTVSEEFAVDIIKAGADDYLLKDRLTRLPAAIEAAIQKKNIEAAGKQAAETIRFKADLLKSVGQAVIATTLDGTVLFWNQAAEKIYGWTVQEAMGANIMDLTPSLQSIDEAKAIMQELEKGNTWSGEFLVKHRDGHTFPVYVTDSPLLDAEGNISGVIGVSYDITGQKQAENSLRDMEKQMAEQRIREQKKISRAIIKGQEEEKNHIGKELHDNINQILVGAKMFLSMAAKKNAEIKDLLQYPIELINSSIEEIRSLTYKQVTALRNIELDGLLQRMAESVKMSAALEVTVAYSANDPILSDELKLNLYRIVQEQVNNILKHAAAKTISITVQQQEHYITLQIDDDGKGFNPAEEKKGVGIFNMKNRVDAYDGKLEIISSPGKGCTLKVSIPF